MAAIVVAEDDQTIRSILVEALRQEGHRVLEATNGAEALKALEESRIDLVATDMVMPDKDGVEVLYDLRAKYPGVKSIAFSGGGRYGDCMYLAIARRLGARQVLNKPFKVGAFLDAVRETLDDVSSQTCAEVFPDADEDRPIPST